MNYIIGLPVSPAKHLDTTSKMVTKILITFGGGMGGSNKTYYATKMEKLNENEVELSLYDGEVIIINPTFIVERKEVQLIHNAVDSTDHTNYYQIKVKKSITNRFIVIGKTDTFSLSNELQSYSNNDLGDKLIDTTIDITPI